MCGQESDCDKCADDEKEWNNEVKMYVQHLALLKTETNE